MVSTGDMLESYYDCRKGKRSTASAVIYEMDYEAKLIALRDRINARTYQPAKSICFVVTRPRYREVFAASFEDRIVHHYIALRLEPLFEATFLDRTFNCRKGKGQLYGVEMLKRDIVECSENYTRDCWIMKLDLQGFFMSIIKSMLADMIDRFIVENYKGDDIEDLRYLCRVVIMHEPEKNCERHSPLHYWSHLAKNKSLFTNGAGRGIAIGNLFAQLFANFLLDILDKFIDKRIKLHGRYVDDFYLISRDKQELLSIVPEIRKLLDGLGLQLSPKKFYLQHYTKGIEFTGTVVKPGRTYVCNRTITNFVSAVRRLNKAQNMREVEHAVASINSYLGLLRHHNEYANRRKILMLIDGKVFRWIYIKGSYKTVAIKKRYRQRAKTLEAIRNGTEFS